MTDLPEGQLGRVPFPAIGWVMDQPTIIHDISSQGVKAVVPEYGRVILLSLNWLAIRQELAFYSYNQVANPSDGSSDCLGFLTDPQIPSQPD